MSPTITFNLKREDDTWFGYREVEKLASLSGIHLRVSVQTSLLSTWCNGVSLRGHLLPMLIPLLIFPLLYCRQVASVTLELVPSILACRTRI